MIGRDQLRWIIVSAVGIGLIVSSVSAGGNEQALEDATAIRGAGVAADRSFVELLIPLNRQMAALSRVARVEASRPQLRRFAARQLSEFPRLNRRLTRFADLIGARVAASGLPPLLQIEGDSGSLGQSVAETGFQLRLLHREGEVIDRRFVNLAISINQSSVRIARAAYLEGSVKHLQQLALRTVHQRIGDINRLNRWYVRWYGKRSPVGGVPAGQ